MKPFSGELDLQPFEGELDDTGFGEQLTQTIKGLPRAAGLAGRDVVEGLAAIPGLVTDPIIDIANYYLPEKWRQTGAKGAAKMLMDAFGAPVPETPTERVTSDISRLLAGGGGIVKGAQVLSKTVPAAVSTGQNIAKVLSTRPELQAAGAVGAGGAGGYVRETGGDELTQLLAAITGGVLAPTSLAGGQKLTSIAQNVIKRRAPNQKIDIIINTAAEQSGINVKDITSAVRGSMRDDMREALKTGEVSPDIVRRLVDYRMTGLTPTAGPLTRDPGVFTRQENLSRTGAASGDPALQKLSQIKNENARKLVENLNDLGADTADDAYRASQKVIKALGMKNKEAKKVIDEFYKLARGTEGRSAKLDHVAFSKKANDLLDENMVGGKLPSDVRNVLNSISEGKTPLTVDVAEQLKTKIGALQRASGMTDQQGKLALGYIRQALEETPLLEGQGQKAINAFNKARSANRQYMQIVEKTPALKAVRDGIEPDKFMQTYIIGKGKDASLQSNMRLKRAIKDFPEAKDAIKNNMANWLKKKALSGAADETGTFSQSAYNKAIEAVGLDKLRLFFTKYEIQQLKAIGRVSSYEQSFPAGSAVNVSNTSAAVASLLDRIAGNTIIRGLPFGRAAIADPAKNISIRLQGKDLTAIPNIQKEKVQNMYIPAVLAPYLLNR